VVNEVVRPLGMLSVFVYGALLIALFFVFRKGLVVVLREAVKLHLP